MFQVVQFSPDGTLLALGSRDNYIYIYQGNEDATKYSRVGRCMVRLFYVLKVHCYTGRKTISTDKNHLCENYSI